MKGGHLREKKKQTTKHVISTPLSRKKSLTHLAAGNSKEKMERLCTNLKMRKRKLDQCKVGPLGTVMLQATVSPLAVACRPPAVYNGLNLEAEITKAMEEANPAPKELIFNCKTSLKLVLGLTVLVF